MIVVRPDQHVANVLPLDAYDALSGVARPGSTAFRISKSGLA